MRAPIAALVALILTIATVPLSAPASAAQAAVFHVDCSAATSGDGSSARPWSSLGAVDQHPAFLPGDQILLRRGRTCRGRLNPSGSGADGMPIVLGAYGTGAAPVIAAGGSPNGTGAVQLVNQHDWTIEDLAITNTSGSVSTQVYRSGVSVLSTGTPTPGLAIRRLRISNVSSAPNDRGDNSRTWGGITVVARDVVTDPFDGLQIMGNTLSAVGRSGVFVANTNWGWVRSHGVRISGNRIAHARGDGIVVYGLSGARIDHNTVAFGHDMYPCPLCGPQTPTTASAGIWPAMSDGTLIDHNEVYGTLEKGGDGEAFDVDTGATGTVLEDNYAHDNEGGGILFCGAEDTIARFNILQNNGRAPFSFIGNVPAHGTKIYNNTVYAKKRAKTEALRTFNGTSDSDVSFFNNIVENHASGAWRWPSSRISTQANTLIGTHTVGRPHDPLTSTMNPGLKKPGSGKIGFRSLKGYQPKSHAAVQHGVAIPADITRDFFGRPIDPGHPPRGAAG